MRCIVFPSVLFGELRPTMPFGDQAQDRTHYCSTTQTTSRMSYTVMLVARTPVVARSGQLFASIRDGPYTGGIAGKLGRLLLCAPVLRTSDWLSHQVSGGSTFPLNGLPIEVCEIELTSRNPGIVSTIRSHFLNTYRVWRTLRDVEAVFVFMPGWAAIQASILAKLAGKPVISYFGADSWNAAYRHAFRWAGWRGHLLRPVYDWATRVLEEWVARSSAGILYTGRRARWQRDTLRPIIRTLPLTPMRSSEVFRREDTCLQKPIRCLFVGSLLPGKGLEYLIEALAHVDAPIVLTIAGPDEGGMLPRLTRIAALFGVKDRVQFIGMVSDHQELLQCYRSADIFVLPAVAEGFPRVIYEAMSQGLPTVCTAVGGIPDVIRDQVSGILVPPRSPLALAKALHDVINDGPLRRRLIQGGYETIAPLLDCDAAEQAADLILRVINSPPPSARR